MRGATLTAHKGASQEFDQVRTFGPITKRAARIDRADLIPEVLRHAYQIPKSGKPGPVQIDIPQDIRMQRLAMPAYIPTGTPDRARGEAAKISKAAQLLGEAEAPLIVALAVYTSPIWTPARRCRA